MMANHEPVMTQEILELLGPCLPGGKVVDCTVGLGGHAQLLAQHIGPTGALLGIDRDPQALALAAKNLQNAPCSVFLEQNRFDELESILENLHFAPLDAVLLDLGVSSLQLDQPERGFSFMGDGPLDMRMGPDTNQTAADILANYSEENLAKIFFEYGEERFSRRIARAIAHDRKKQPFRTTNELTSLIRSVIGRKEADSRIHPSTRVFQALRIELNEELDQIQPTLETAMENLRPGGRLAVISFHSLEDRIVKNLFRFWASDCVCPPRQPICNCDKTSQIEILTPKPWTPTEEEKSRNPRSRSAKLRAMEKLGETSDAS